MNISLALAFCSLLLILSGCAAQEGSKISRKGSYSASERLIIESTAEEVVEAPDLPADDGIPLTLEEKIALHSTGELDRYLTLEQKQQVEMHFKTYLHRGRKRFTNYLERAQIYLPQVKLVFREMGVPEDIAYLAFVESGFNPNAVSSAGATGMWQFMRYTGRRYGLSQNAWIDERRDPHKATVAAALYLNQLYEHFGDWLLAVAAYNAGEGKIMRAMESTGAADFFELCLLNDSIQEDKRKLRNETQQYVPTFLAVVKIMRNLELLGFEAQSDLACDPVTTLRLPPNTDLRALSAKLGMKFETFQATNPAFRKTTSPPTAYSTAYIPATMEAKAVEWLATPKAVSTPSYNQYVVRKGDTLSSIASKQNVTVDMLKQANKLKSNNLSIGMKLKIPATGASTAQTTASSKTTASKAAAPVKADNQKAQSTPTKASSHTVARGETLFSIARKYDVTVDALRSANKLKASSSNISVGQKLSIPGKAAVAAAPAKASQPTTAKTQKAAASGKVHTVQAGETLYSLSKTYKVSLAELLSANGMTDKSVLKIGQKLRIP